MVPGDAWGAVKSMASCPILLAQFADHLDENGRRLVVREGYQQAVRY